MRSIYVMCRRLFLFFCILTSFLQQGRGQCEKATDLSVSDVTENAVTLEWASSNAQAIYEVEIKSKGRTPKLKQTISTDLTSLHFEGLVAGSEYRFRVRTMCEGGSSSGSTKWSVFETAGMNPEEDCPKATGLSVVSATMTTATLAWTGSPYSTHYEVEVRSKGNTATYFFEKSLLDTSVTIFGLEPNGKYHFRVRTTCINSAVSGSTSWYAFRPGDSPEQETCPFIEDLMADSITNTSVVVVWSTFGDNTVYELTVSDGQGNDMVVAPASPPQFIQGLSPETEYEISVVAHCEDGVPSQVNLFFTTGEEIADTCAIPENLGASVDDSSSFTLSWDPVSGAESYDLQINDLDTVPNLLVDTNIVDALYLFQILDSLEGYTFRVRALCSAESMSDWSEYYFFPSATDSLVLACETPTDLMVDTVIGNNVFLSWTPTDAIGFEVEIQDGVNTMTKTVGAISEIGSVYFSGLEAMTTYQARIRPICREEEGGFSIAISFTTGEEMIICLPVMDLRAERLDDNTASLSWSEIDGATYETEVRSQGSSTGMLTIPSVDPELMVSGLDPALIYEFRVHSICSSGDTSLFTHWISFSTEDPQVGTCTAPTGINLDSVNSTEAWISWLGVDTLEYQVFWKEKDTIAAPEVYMTTEHFIYLDSLMPETEYMIQVQKLCGDELSPLSEPFYFTTLMIGDSVPDSLCVAPSDLKLDSVDVNDAWISWMAEDSLLFEVEVTGTDFEYFETVGMSMIWLTGLTENTEYTLRVRSLCTDSTSSEWSDDFIFQTLEMPEEPEDSCRVPIAEIISIGAESAMGSWTSSSSGAFYLIEVENIGLTPNYRLITTTRDTSYLFEDLVPGGTYQWKVAAFCPDGSYSDCTEWMTFTTEGTGDCEAPDGLAVDQLTTTGAMLIWNNAPSAIDYEVEIQSLDTTPFYGVSNILLENELSVDGLVPGGSYQFKVNVQCLDGTISEDSDWYLFSTLTGQDTGTISNSVAQRVQMVFPNPVRQTMSVKLPEELLEKTANIELTDMMGRVVRSIEQASVQGGTLIRFAVGDLREGIYQLSVRSEDKFYHELVMIAR